MHTDHTDQTRRDLRLAIPAAAVWLGAWAVPVLGARWSVAAVALLGASGLGFSRRAPWWVTTALVLAAGSAAAMAIRVDQLHADPLHQWVSQQRHVEITGVLTEDPSFVDRSGFATGDRQVVVQVRAQRVVSGSAEITLRTPVLVLGNAEGWEDLAFGESVEVSGRLRPASSTDPYSAVMITTTEPVEVGSSSPPLRAAETMRSGLREAVGALPPDVQGLLPALVVGDTTQMPALLTADMNASGLTHLTAVSGANVAIVMGAAMLVARRLGIHAYWLLAVGLSSVVWFVLLARPQPSVLRAAAMGALALLAVATAGRTQAVRSLLATVVVLLLVDPWLARSWGFALSVAATAGLVLLSRSLLELLPERVPRPLREAASVALAAQITTLPLVLAVSGQLAPLAVLANVLVAPAVPAATVLGVLAATLSPVSATAAALVAWLAQWPTWWITAVARWTAGSPLSTLPWPAGWAGGALGLAAIALLSGLVLVGSRRRWWRPRRVVALTLLAGTLAAAYTLGPGRWPPPGWVVVACDVGQGDSLVVNLGSEAAMVVDTGPDPELADRCLDRLGVHEVPILFLTHFHADHVDGLPGVLDGREVGRVLVSPLRSPSDQVEEVASSTAETPVASAQPGQTGRWGQASWQVLWPGDLVDPGDAEGSAPNNASIVLLVEVAGVRLLLTGDVEPEAQAALLEQGVPEVDVLKVPHHGSKYQNASFLAEVGARVALVSVGADNGYGHPDPRLMSWLESAGLAVARTDELGSVAVVSDGEQLRVVPMP